MSPCVLAKEQTTVPVWFCAVQQTALDPGSGLYVIKTVIALSFLAGSHRFSQDNCLGHHVLQIHHYLFIFKLGDAV